MTKKEMLEKARYIQYPLKNKTYINYNNNFKIFKLPLPKDGMMYSNWEKNDNHFTTEYHRLYSIPLLCELLDLKYDTNDFVIDERESGNFNISILKPKKEYKYEIFGYTRDEYFNNLSFEDITSNNSTKKDITDYHRLYKYSHECSRIINKTLENEKKIFISGDSQMIPNVSFLTCFFKETWYFDNRDKLNLHDNYEDVDFTHILIELNDRSLNQYVNINFN